MRYLRHVTLPNIRLLTLALADAQVIHCPFSRRHFIKSCTNSVAQFGCTYDYELIMHFNCSNTSSGIASWSFKSFEHKLKMQQCIRNHCKMFAAEKFCCIGYWRENEMQYIVSRKTTSLEFLCHIYSSHSNGITYIHSYRRSFCHSNSSKQSQPYHNFTFAKYDGCFPLNGVSRKTEINSLLATIFIRLSFAVISYSGCIG